MDKALVAKRIKYRFGRSSGSGGQHVNKVETRVELYYELEPGAGLSEVEMDRVRQVMGKRISSAGRLVLVSQATRSQALNKAEVTERFFQLLEEALRTRPKRRKPFKQVVNHTRRLDNKKRQGEKKALRKSVRNPDSLR